MRIVRVGGVILHRVTIGEPRDEGCARVEITRRDSRAKAIETRRNEPERKNSFRNGGQGESRDRARAVQTTSSVAARSSFPFS